MNFTTFKKDSGFGIDIILLETSLLKNDIVVGDVLTTLLTCRAFTKESIFLENVSELKQNGRSTGRNPYFDTCFRKSDLDR